MITGLSEFFKSVGAVLTFRIDRERIMRFDERFLFFALVLAWLVGIARYWNNVGASPILHSGITSLIYVTILALLIFLTVMPFQIEGWSYKAVATFVAMTSPIGLIYLLPIEKNFGIESANVWHLRLLIVSSLWRLAILFLYLKASTRLGWLALVTCTLLPLTFLVVLLTALNLDKVYFDFLGGQSGFINNQNTTSNDASYRGLVLLTAVSILTFLPLMIGYFIALKSRLADKIR